MLLSTLFLAGGAIPAKPLQDNLEPPVRLERVAELAQASTWQKLLHYTAPSLGLGRAESDVLSSNFFLSPRGKTDPAAELAATLAAMKAPVGDNPDEHAQCRFPARLIWMRSVDLISSDVEAVKCPAFRAWLGDKPISGASLIFASGHLGNPSTFYGHMLLRLNAAMPDRQDRDQLLGKALNHGALFPENENGIVYIFKGLTGGYSATFSDLSFFNHEHRWNQDQLRDVWEYELELDASQVELLAAHSWEMRESQVPYFFLKQNCAFRIAEMVSVVLDETILPTDKPWVMPVDVLDVAQQTQNNGKSLVRDVRLLPSTQTKFREAYQALPREQRAIVRNFIEGETKDVEPMVADLSPDQQASVIETLIDYHGMAGSADADPEKDKQTRNNLLLARLQRPGGSHQDDDTARLPPHEGNKTSLVQVSAGYNSERGETLQLRLRGAFNDFLSRAPGSLPYSELSLGDIRVNIDEEGVFLRSADIVRITTLSLSETGLPEDGAMAWRLRFGAEQDRLDCDDCLSGFVEGGVGKAAFLMPGLVGYGFVNGRLMGPEQEDGVGHVGVSAGLITDPMQFARAHVEVGAWQDIDGDGRTRSYAQVEARFGTSSRYDWNFVLKAEDDGRGSVMESRIGVSLYW